MKLTISLTQREADAIMGSDLRTVLHGTPCRQTQAQRLAMFKLREAVINARRENRDD